MRFFQCISNKNKSSFILDSKYFPSNYKYVYISNIIFPISYYLIQQNLQFVIEYDDNNSIPRSKTVTILYGSPDFSTFIDQIQAQLTLFNDSNFFIQEINETGKIKLFRTDLDKTFNIIINNEELDKIFGRLEWSVINEQYEGKYIINLIQHQLLKIKSDIIAKSDNGDNVFLILNQMQSATFSIFEKNYQKEESIREYSGLIDFYLEFRTYDNQELILNSEIEWIVTLCFVEQNEDFLRKLYELEYDIQVNKLEQETLKQQQQLMQISSFYV